MVIGLLIGVLVLQQVAILGLLMWMAPNIKRTHGLIQSWAAAAIKREEWAEQLQKRMRPDEPDTE
jgi:hypothetical protein